ncbi:MAG: hypothetical protein ACYTBJ_06715 [Planctomycetota bacterium]|jgi:hypothetical protein
MGINFLGVFHTLIKYGAPIVQMLLGKEKPSLLDGVGYAAGQIFPAVDNLLKMGKLSTKEQVDQWLDTLDAKTGTDAGAIDIFRDMPQKVEEEFFDHMKEAVRIYAYSRIGVEGFIEKE